MNLYCKVTNQLREQWVNCYDEWQNTPWYRPIKKMVAGAKLDQAYKAYRTMENELFSVTTELLLKNPQHIS